MTEISPLSTPINSVTTTSTVPIKEAPWCGHCTPEEIAQLEKDAQIKTIPK